MPLLKPTKLPTEKDALFDLGVARATQFCLVNKIPPPHIVSVPSNVWPYEKCAYYRPDHKGIRVCITKCATVAGEAVSKNWNWPGSTTDREPYGVIQHEIGHHVDYLTGKQKYQYSSNYSRTIMKTSGEEPITSYCPNHAEWFAEMFRLFITNAYLLAALRPKTFRLLRQKWAPVSNQDWRKELGANVPKYIVINLEKKL